MKSAFVWNIIVRESMDIARRRLRGWVIGRQSVPILKQPEYAAKFSVVGMEKVRVSGMAIIKSAQSVHNIFLLIKKREIPLRQSNDHRI